jgi:hypothetical protein
MNQAGSAKDGVAQGVRQLVFTVALGASLMGTGLGLLSRPAQAGILYVPTNTPILGWGTQFYLDDGAPEIRAALDFQNPRGCSMGSCGYALIASPYHSDGQGFVLADGPYGFALALTAGAPIGPGGLFVQSPFTMVEGEYCYDEPAPPEGMGLGRCPYGAVTWRGPWADVTSRYLGFAVPDIGGLTHYGWVRLDVTVVPSDHNQLFHGTVTGYAINLSPNEPIRAGQTPEPGALTLVVLGAASFGFLQWRRTARMRSPGPPSA